ncbi:hypothetical protein R1sor_010297 [Riccia sorocarpa]|uniref:DUF7953 domain-containing protein n=1 Tax=Riccia sorocarpa TaxID=122646 RepID=A0ABD3I1P2_9MARC
MRGQGMADILNVLVLIVLLLYLSFEVVVADGNVTLESMTIFTTHEWFRRNPTVYFQCQEEKKVFLPDVIHKGVSYSFLGQESWQPLTTLYGTKCKRCGFYEQDTIKADDTFFEWELCPKEFSYPDGRYEVFQEKEFNATFICGDCVPKNSTESDALKVDEEEEKGEDHRVAVISLILVLVLLFLVGLAVVAYMNWRRKQRADQQARFMKMFEDDNDLDAELGLKDYLTIAFNGGIS